eukprot:351509-Chlamydomonas_euryale.AAC.7
MHNECTVNEGHPLTQSRHLPALRPLHPRFLTPSMRHTRGILSPSAPFIHGSSHPPCATLAASSRPPPPSPTAPHTLHAPHARHPLALRPLHPRFLTPSIRHTRGILIPQTLHSRVHAVLLARVRLACPTGDAAAGEAAHALHARIARAGWPIHKVVQRRGDQTLVRGKRLAQRERLADKRELCRVLLQQASECQVVVVFLEVGAKKALASHVSFEQDGAIDAKRRKVLRRRNGLQRRRDLRKLRCRQRCGDLRCILEPLGGVAGIDERVALRQLDVEAGRVEVGLRGVDGHKRGARVGDVKAAAPRDAAHGGKAGV